MVAEAARLEELVGQVLDFVRSGRLERRPEDPAALARAAIEEVDPGRVRLETRGAPPRCQLDPTRMQRVLVNLLSNALQASPGDEPVDLTVEAAAGALDMELRDRGGGLEPGDEERIFEPFYTRRVKGTGLGLAVARQVVEGHGGRLTARNHPEGGAVFRVELPL